MQPNTRLVTDEMMAEMLLRHCHDACIDCIPDAWWAVCAEGMGPQVACPDLCSCMQEKHDRNERMACTLTLSLKELQRAQAALQAEQAAFAAEKQQWRDSMQAAARHVQLMAQQPVEEFILDPKRHSVQVLASAPQGPSARSCKLSASCLERRVDAMQQNSHMRGTVWLYRTRKMHSRA